MWMQIFYMKPSYFRAGSAGFEFCKEQGLLPDAADLEKTHVLLREDDFPSLEAAFRFHQAENWSPNGEACDLIQSKGLEHTSMSVGDIVKTGEGVFMCDRFGFSRLPTARKKRIAVKAAPSDPELAKIASGIFFVAKPTEKHIDQVKAAQRGEMPERPNVDCPAYAKCKAKFWPRVEAALVARDDAALEAIAADIQPRRTSRKIIRAYALLSALALKAGANLGKLADK